MPDYRTLFDSDYLYAFHLQGKEVTVEIVKVTGGELTGQGGKKSRKPIVYFRGKEKPMAFNKTNCKTLAAMYGNDTSKWVGKRVTIYPTTTNFGNETVDCIRVRPGIPKGNARSAPEPTPPADTPDYEPPLSEPPQHVELPAWEPGADG